MNERLHKIGRGIDMTRKIVVNGFFLLLILILLIGLIGSRVEIADGSALLLNIEGELVEETTPTTPVEKLMSPGHRSETGLFDLLAAIRLAAKDERIKLIVLDLSNMKQAPLVRLSEVRQALLEFRKSGKKVVLSADMLTQGDYYLASAADRIELDPMGGILITGYGLYSPYFKEMLDNLGVVAHVFRAGDFKSAGEFLTRNNMSEESRRAEMAWLGQVWEEYKRAVATSRKIDPMVLQNLADQPGTTLATTYGDDAKLAINSHLADKLASRADFTADLKLKLGSDGSDVGYPHVLLHDYLTAMSSERHFPALSSNYVAIVQASGQIGDSDGGPGFMPVNRLIDRLKQARLDPKVKAVVLRVDSPGGSAFASERIRRAVAEVRATGLPVVVSMGPLAASGGYWISAQADEIWANPATLTGSIGVIGIVPKFGEGLNKLGIHVDGIQTGLASTALRPDLPMAPEAADAIQLGINSVYDRFLTIVAEGRKLNKSRVHEIAQGRIWSGADARRIKLVDHLGGLNDAIAAAARRAQISKDYEAVVMRGKSDLRSEMLEAWSEMLSASQQEQMAALFGIFVDNFVSPLADTQLRHNLPVPLPFWNGKPLAFSPLMAP